MSKQQLRQAIAPTRQNMAEPTYHCFYVEPANQSNCLLRSRSIQDSPKNLRIPAEPMKKLGPSVWRRCARYTNRRLDCRLLECLNRVDFTACFQCETAAIFGVQFVVVDIMGKTEEGGTEKSEKRSMLEVWIDYPANQCSVDKFDAEWNLNRILFTINNFLKRSHWNCFL